MGRGRRPEQKSERQTVVSVVAAVPESVAHAVTESRRKVLVEIAVAAFMGEWAPVAKTTRLHAMGGATGAIH